MRNMMTQTMRNWMVGMTVATGLMVTGTVAANAAPQAFRGGGERGVPFHGNVEPQRNFNRGFDNRSFETRGYENHGLVRRYDRGYVSGYVGGGYAPGYGVVVDNYIPPCPGDGYVWTAGYYNDGAWIPGVWSFRGVGFGRAYGRGYEERDFAGRNFEDRGFAGRGIENRRFAERGFEHRGFEEHGGRGFGGEGRGRR